MEIWPGHQGHTPTLYEMCHGIINGHRESEPWFNVSSERQGRIGKGNVAEILYISLLIIPCII